MSWENPNRYQRVLTRVIGAEYRVDGPTLAYRQNNMELSMSLKLRKLSLDLLGTYVQVSGTTKKAPKEALQKPKIQWFK